MDSNSLHTKASQETLISLMQLDPTPIDSASLNEKELPPLPEEALESSTHSLNSQPTGASTSSSLGLSSSGHGPIFYLTRIQKYSSYTFGVFAGLHIANTSIFPLVYQSVPYSEPLLLMAREIYQTQISEPLLVALPLVAHIGSGIALRLVRRHQNLKRYGGATPGMYALHRSKSASTAGSGAKAPNLMTAWPPLSYISLSGYLLVPVLGAHIFMNRVAPLIVEGDSSNIGLQYVSHGFARHAIQSWVAYTLLIGLGAGHIVWGAAKWLGLTPPPRWRQTTVDKRLRRERRNRWWTITSVGAAAAGLWGAGLLVVAREGRATGWLGGVYDAIYTRFGQ